MIESQAQYLSAVEDKALAIREQFDLELELLGQTPDDFISATRLAAEGAVMELETLATPHEVYGAVAVLAGAKEVLRTDSAWNDYDFEQAVRQATSTRRVLMPNDAAALALEQARVEFNIALSWRQIVGKTLGRLVLGND